MKRSAPPKRNLDTARAFERRGRESSARSLNGSRSSLTTTRRSAWGGLRTQKVERACRNCGATGCVIELHHAVPRSRSRKGRDDLRNALPLCRECHNGWHAGTPIYRDAFTADEWEFIETLIGPGWLGRHYPTRPRAQAA